MADKDIISTSYFKDKRRAAEILNAVLYQGKQVLTERDLEERSPVFTKSERKSGDLQTDKKEVDAAYEVSVPADADGGSGRFPVTVLFQLQTNASTVMPLRDMNVNTDYYLGQWRGISKRHQIKKDLKAGMEFTSEFSEQDTLVPALNLTVYFGRETWRGARELHDLFRFPSGPEKLREMVGNYPVNLLDIRRFPNPEWFATDLRILIGYLKRDRDKKELERFVEENKSEFSQLQEDTYDLIAVMSGSEKLIKLKD